ncbi:hypothetical protein [Streptomyces sp. NPDC014894]|uniref:hypothetical protein n=1 Tax=Streptomyces sp. NPDC014894 TaxID=3364931 RepID=UPI0036FF6F0D
MDNETHGSRTARLRRTARHPVRSLRTDHARSELGLWQPAGVIAFSVVVVAWLLHQFLPLLF